MRDMIDLEIYYSKIEKAETLKELEDIHKEVFSKKGYFSSQMKNMSSLSLEEKKAQGQVLNAQKNSLMELFEKKTVEIRKKNLENKIKSEYLDLTLPVEKINCGGVHLISNVTEQIIAIFDSMEFKVFNANEIEEDWYNFTALNIPEHHPSRQDHDTFYLNSKDSRGNRKVLRTHTSNAQIRAMLSHRDQLEQGESIKIISLGRTYRSDADSTHSPMFHQAEGFYVDRKENISVPLLKSILHNFCSSFFGLENMSMRFRSSYFPFTSPSYEIDLQCDKSQSNLILGKGEDWLEILGSGIIHANVLENCGIDSEKYAGIAFGIGIERLTMLKYSLRDIRDLYRGDIRWLKHHNINPVKTPSIFGGLR